MKNRFFWMLGLLVALACSACATEKVFFGRWSPPDLLLPFWGPLEESWWGQSENARIIEYAKDYAQKSDPRVLLPEIVKDLKAHPSMERTFVYSMLVMHWDRKVTLPLLKEYYRSSDLEAQSIAADFIADIEEVSKSEARKGQQ